MREDSDSFLARLVVWLQRPPKGGMCAEQLEEVSGDANAVESLGLSDASQVRRPVREHGHPSQAGRVLPIILEIGQRERRAIEFASGVVHPHQLLRIPEWQFPKDYVLNKGVHHGRGANTKRQSRDGKRTKSWRPPEGSTCMAKACEKLRHDCSPVALV